MKCEKCNLEFSDAVFPIHIKRCGVKNESDPPETNEPEIVDPPETNEENSALIILEKLQDLSYDNLKAKATELEIGFVHNIKKTDLIELIKNKLEQ